MKILVCVAGSWKHGLDSPERGESRWAQNIARLLGKSGLYKVYAASPGDPNAGKGRPAPGVELIHHDEIRNHEPYDLYFGADQRPPLATAHKYFHIHWGFDGYLKDHNFPKNHYILYPHFDMEAQFVNDSNPNRDRTFFLPTPFCEELSPPAFNRNGLLWPTKDPTLVSPPEDSHTLLAALREVRQQIPELKAYWWFVQDMESKGLIDRSDYPGDEFIELSPYWKMLEVIDKCKLNVILGNPNCIPDCAVKGTPSLIWDSYHVMPFVHDVARKHNLLIPLRSSKEVVKETLVKLLTEEQLYNSFTNDLQYVFRHHVESEVQIIFQQILNRL